MRPYATSVGGLTLLVSYILTFERVWQLGVLVCCKCMRPYATSVGGLKLLVSCILTFERVWQIVLLLFYGGMLVAQATSVCGLKLLVYEALSY
jgi:hypothetical protein